MGWYGSYCINDLHCIKAAIEQELKLTFTNGTKQEILYHSFKFGKSYLAIEQVKETERIVFAVVCLWRYSKDAVMIKTMDESCGPYYYDAPMKLLKMLTPSINNSSHNWRVTCWKKYKKIPEEYKEYKKD